MVFVLRVFLVTVNGTVGGGLAGFPFDTNSGFLLAAQVAQIPFVHDVEEGGKFIAVLVVAVHAVGDGNEVDAVLPKEYLRIKAGLQIVTPRPAHILDDHMGNLARLNICDELLPCRTLEIAAAPAVVRIVAAVGVASLPGIAFEVFFLIHDGIAIPGIVIVAGQPLIESGNFAFSFSCPYELHELTANSFLSKLFFTLSDEQKEVLYYLFVKQYSTTRLAAIRGQSDRNIRKLRMTIQKKLQKRLYEHLSEKLENDHGLTLREREFVEEYEALLQTMGKDAVIRRENKTKPRKKKAALDDTKDG